MTPTSTATPPTSIKDYDDAAMSSTPMSPNPAPERTSLREFAEALTELDSLENGWDSYGAAAPTPAALSAAWSLASQLGEMNVPVPQIFPTRRGGVQLEWHTPHTSLEWEIDPAGTSGIFIFDNHQTGEKIDGEFPTDNYEELGRALSQVLTDR